MAARAHRANEDAWIEEVVGEADAVAEQRAMGERARRIDGDHADRALLSAEWPISPEMRLDFPTPGGPVIPTA